MALFCGGHDEIIANLEWTDKKHQAYHRQHLSLIASKYRNNQLQSKHALILIGILGGILALNYFFQIIAAHTLAVLGVVVLLPLADSKIEKMTKYEET